VANVDMNIRKTTNMPEKILQSLEQVMQRHNEAGKLDFDLRLGLRHK
jgi:hypothetical protein